MALTKIKTLRASETYNVNSINANTVTVAGTSVTGGGGSSSFPGILTIKVTSNNYSFLDDTSVNTSGGFIQVGGVNFNANCTLLIGANIQLLPDHQYRPNLAESFLGIRALKRHWG